MKLTVKELVQELLTNKPHLRDSDERLIATVWYHEAGMSQNNNLLALDLLNLYIDKKLSSPESIRRSRQKLQQVYPLLRGKAYNKRHNEQVEETLNELKEI